MSLGSANAEGKEKPTASPVEGRGDGLKGSMLLRMELWLATCPFYTHDATAERLASGCNLWRRIMLIALQ